VGSKRRDHGEQRVEVLEEVELEIVRRPEAVPA